MILFLSKYPCTKEEFRDGFFQRVVDIDNNFEHDERVYLSISLFKNISSKEEGPSETLRRSYFYNLFFHFFLIIRLFRTAKLVYVQSLYNALYSFLFIKYIKNTYVLDLHGVVPEELEYQGLRVKSAIFNFIEKSIFGKLDICIAVTQRMADYYKLKYPRCKCEYIVYTIFPSNLTEYHSEKDDHNNCVSIIYSGNTQKWQNIDFMLGLIKNNLYSNYKYTILTGELEKMKDALVLHQLDKEESIELRSVSPSKLKDYYKKAHYGFVLRDDVVVNNVACPTKLVEYMFYGIIPIVLSDNVGDFKELNYDRIHWSTMDAHLEARKSHSNVEIIKKLRQSNKFSLKKKVNLH